MRSYNPKVSKSIFKEVEKNAQRMNYLSYSSFYVGGWNWSSVKKNGEIIICVDFCNLNQASLKDNYALPILENLLQKVAGVEMIPTLDCFLGYNQISVAEDDEQKKTFITSWRHSLTIQCLLVSSKLMPHSSKHEFFF